MQTSKNNTVIIVLGPTCVGKTALSVILAKILDTEIISSDSMQIYRNMNIGTAKPSQKDLRDIKHHLINILSPSASFSAGMFKKAAVKIIDSLHDKNKVPVIVGGTGLYIKTLTGGLFEGPRADWSLRERLVQDEKKFGKGHLFGRLMKTDPVSADRIHPGDTRRIVRALEVLLNEGKTISDLQRSLTMPQPYTFIKVGLLRERRELYSLIEKRVDTMMDNGLLQETEELLKTAVNRTPLQALGYKEMKLYIDGLISMEDAVKLLKKRTRMYAKRQVTWFKKEPHINWVDITGIMDAEKIFSKVKSDIEILNELLYGN